MGRAHRSRGWQGAADDAPRRDYVSRYTGVVLPPVSWTESETHIARHQVVAPHEVEEVLYGRPRYLAPGRSGTRLVFGTTTAGRHLLVVIADAPDGGVGIVTARAMTDTEKRAFRRKGN